MTNNYITHLKELLAAATPGPWYIKTRASEMGDDFTIEPNVVTAWATDGDFGTDLSIQNAQLIANAPTDIATLLKAYEIMEKALKFYSSRGCGFTELEIDGGLKADEALDEVRKLWEKK